MCKNAATKPKTNGNSEENVNFGLLNVLSNSLSWLSIETVMEIASLIILSILVIRWINKCRNKRKAEKMRRISELKKSVASRQTSSFISELPNSFIQEFPSVSGPTETRAIMHTQPATVNHSPKGMAKYRLLGMKHRT